MAAHGAGHDVARLQSGDLSVYMRSPSKLSRLDRLGIPYTLTPGVRSCRSRRGVAARADSTKWAQNRPASRAAPRRSCTGRTSAAFAATGATLAIHLGVQALDRIVAQTRSAGPTVRSRWWPMPSRPGEKVVQGTLGDIEFRLAADPIERSGPHPGRACACRARLPRDALYDPEYRRRFPRKARPRRGRSGAGDSVGAWPACQDVATLARGAAPRGL